jgi:hypothetical protein
LEFKNIILEEKLSNKFKNGHEFFFIRFRFPEPLPPCKREKFFMTIFEFIGQFYFQNDVFKLQIVFSELDISVFLENGLGSFQTLLILQI